MKKAMFMAIAALLLSVSTTAQKGAWIVGLGGGYDKTSFQADTANSTAGHPDLSLTSWSLNTRIGYHVTKNIAIGVLGGYGVGNSTYAYYYSNSASVIEVKSVKYSVGVFGRYTTWIGKHLFIYTQLSATKYGTDNTIGNLGNYYNLPVSTSYPPMEGNGVVVDLSPVVGCNIFKGFGVHMDAGGINYNVFNTSTNKISELNVTLGQRFSFGLHKIIGWKKMQTGLGEAEAAKAVK